MKLRCSKQILSMTAVGQSRRCCRVFDMSGHWAIPDLAGLHQTPIAQSSSDSRFTAAQAGFFDLSQSRDGPDR